VTSIAAEIITSNFASPRSGRYIAGGTTVIISSASGTRRTGRAGGRGYLASGVVAVAAGNLHSQVIKDGIVYSWGTKTTASSGTEPIRRGRAGAGIWRGRFRLPLRVAAVAAGSEYAVALLSVARSGLGPQRPVPARKRRHSQYECLSDPSAGRGRFGLPSDIVAIAAGAYHGLALSASGAVYAWGQNTKGQSDTAHILRATLSYKGRGPSTDRRHLRGGQHSLAVV
jgi:alpha-tubulin suppressor-like RCC1 family protein